MDSGFQHHKYCVVEIAGQLQAETDSCSFTTFYILDHHQAEAEKPPAIQSDSSIQVADNDFVRYLCQHILAGEQSSSQEKRQAVLEVRITGTVGLDGSQALLTRVSEAVIKNADVLLHYEAKI